MTIGSGLQFENRGQLIPETDPSAATRPYAVARIHSAYAARYYRSRGLRAYVAYLFHHESPLRPLPHLSARICHDIAAIARGDATGGVLDVGDLSVEKVWGFAGDVAAALANAHGAGRRVRSGRDDDGERDRSQRTATDLRWNVDRRGTLSFT